MIPIRRRLTRDLLAASLILLGGGWIAFYAIARDELIEQFDSALQAKALAVSALAERDSINWHLVPADGISRDFGPERRRDFFEIWPPGGQPALRSDSLRGADLAPAGTATERRPYWNLTLPTGRPGRAIAVVFQPRAAATDQIADSGDGARLVVASDRTGLDEALRNLLWSAGAGGALLLAAILWGVPRILRRGLRPLEQLGEAVGGLGPDSLARRLPEAGLPDELRPVALRLNDFLVRLERSFERERRFSSDLAHELRTPIAELRSAAECALKWPESREPAHDREILAIAEHMETLVNQLLALARGEQGQIAIRRADLSLEACVAEAWAPFAPRAAERGLQARFELRPAAIAADPTLLRSILHNLFDNAVDYTPAGGEVRVSIETEGGPARLQVANTVAGLEAADVGQLFDRFWRKEASRSGQRHLGLGLPLSRVFAQAMGCALSADLDPANSRLVFTLTAGHSRPMLSHVDAQGRPRMVDVGGKPVTRRTAHAIAVVELPPALAALLQDGDIATKKGPVFQTAILAGTMGAKRTSELIPLCHPLPLDACTIEIEARPPRADGSAEALIHCRVEVHARTGAEMEALTGASIAALTLYDMGKAAAPGIVIREMRLLEKTGGKTDYRAEA